MHGSVTSMVVHHVSMAVWRRVSLSPVELVRQLTYCLMWLRVLNDDTARTLLWCLWQETRNCISKLLLLFPSWCLFFALTNGRSKNPWKTNPAQVVNSYGIEWGGCHVTEYLSGQIVVWKIWQLLWILLFTQPYNDCPLFSEARARKAPPFARSVASLTKR